MRLARLRFDDLTTVLPFGRIQEYDALAVQPPTRCNPAGQKRVAEERRLANRGPCPRLSALTADQLRGLARRCLEFAAGASAEQVGDAREEREIEWSINFVTCHDCFMLVSYNHEHNEANGEGNRDGTADSRRDPPPRQQR